MRNVYASFFLMLVVTLCTSCSDDEPYRMPTSEFPPIVLRIAFTSMMNGSDLLDLSNPLSLLSDSKRPITVTFKGVTYELNKQSENSPNEKDSPVNFKGLRLETYQGKNVLVFGELDGSYLYKDEKMTISWGDYYMESSILIYSIWTYNDNGYPDFARKYTFPPSSSYKLIEDGAQAVIEIPCMDIPI